MSRIDADTEDLIADLREQRDEEMARFAQTHALWAAGLHVARRIERESRRNSGAHNAALEILAALNGPTGEAP